MYGKAPLALPFLLQNNSDLASKDFCPTQWPVLTFYLDLYKQHTTEAVKNPPQNLSKFWNADERCGNTVSN